MLTVLFLNHMMAKTKQLFLKLLRQLEIDCVCDVGSMDGSESLEFRAALPAAVVFAFEANPENLKPMQANPALREKDIRIVPMAAANYEGEAEFFVVKPDPSAAYQRGMSSLYKRSGDLSGHTVAVATTRLDNFLTKNGPQPMKLALWVDVEGKAYEVLEGTSGIARQLCLLHVEVETRPCIAEGQKLYPDVKALLESLGFLELAIDNPPETQQLNLIFIRKDLATRKLLGAQFTTALASSKFHLRRLARGAKKRVLGPRN